MGIELSKEEIFRMLQSGEEKVQKYAALKVSKSYAKREFSVEESAIVEDIFRLLCKRADVFVRMILSETLKDCRDIPHDIALQLAKDIEEVSIPMLEFSQVLSEQDLCDIIDEAIKAKRLAIAKRRGLTQRVITKLFGVKDIEIDNVLKENPYSADIIQSYIPAMVAAKISTHTADDLISAVQAKYDLLPREKLERDKENSAEIATLLLVNDGASVQQINKLVNYLDYNNKLTTSIIVSAICLGKLNFFLYAVAKKVKVTPEVAAKVIKEGGDYGLNLLLKKAGVGEQLLYGLTFILKMTCEKRLAEPNINTHKFCVWLTEKLENLKRHGNMECVNVFLTITKKGRAAN